MVIGNKTSAIKFMKAKMSAIMTDGAGVAIQSACIARIVALTIIIFVFN